ncbi:MAG: arylsulfatase, partial [Armatimonadetes bacterium]|nr:arylsulfatase [Armatimonadota bacterium]
LLDACGIPVPPEVQGRSILPLLRGEREGWPEEAFIQISEAQVGRAVVTRRWKYGVTAPEKSGGRDAGSDHYVEQYLYDLEADPYELVNLVDFDTHREVADVMRRRLLRRMVAAGETEPAIEPPAELRSVRRRGPFPEEVSA